MCAARVKWQRDARTLEAIKRLPGDEVGVGAVLDLS
jgi:hypothetical protein